MVCRCIHCSFVFDKLNKGDRWDDSKASWRVRIASGDRPTLIIWKTATRFLRFTMIIEIRARTLLRSFILLTPLQFLHAPKRPAAARWIVHCLVWFHVRCKRTKKDGQALLDYAFNYYLFICTCFPLLISLFLHASSIWRITKRCLWVSRDKPLCVSASENACES